MQHTARRRLPAQPLLLQRCSFLRCAVARPCPRCDPRSPDADAVHAALRFVSVLLGPYGPRRGAQLLESMDGIDALEAVQYGTAGCRVPELQQWAGELVDAHFGESYGLDEEDDVA
jgi:hypothetical protein